MKGWNVSAPVYTDEELAESRARRERGEVREPSSYEFAILLGLQKQANVYQGPVVDNGSGSAGVRLTEAKIARRRRRGKLQRAARRGQTRATRRAAAMRAGQKRQATLALTWTADPPVLRFLGLRREEPVEIDLDSLDRALAESVEEALP